jgi:Na+-driven multidrug efflux pump
MEEIKNEVADTTLEKEQEKKRLEESRLNKPITVKFLLTFTIPTILSFVIMGIFGLIDGIFAMRGINYSAFAAVNIVFPFVMFSMAIGAMLTMGGCALVVKIKGKGNKVKARQIFSLLAAVIFIISASFSVVGWFIREPLVRMLGARGDSVGLALQYIQPLILMVPFCMLGMFFVQFLVAEGRPTLAMVASILSSMTSTALNALFLFVFDMGLMGLALATGIGYSVSTVIGLIYFTFNRRGTLFLVKPKWDIRALGRASLNGVSEMITMMAGVVTTIVMNNTLRSIAKTIYCECCGTPYSMGDVNIAVVGVVMAAMNIFASLFFGYVAGVAPVVSYNYGKKKRHEAETEVGEDRYSNIRKLYRKSLIIVFGLSLLSVALTNIFADLLVRIYDISPNDPETGFMYLMTIRGIRLVSISMILMGINVFATGWFTAFNDGVVSGTMSIMRSLVFMTILLATLPHIMGLDGAWLAISLVEILGLCVTVFFLWKMGRKYHYLKPKKKATV